MKENASMGLIKSIMMDTRNGDVYVILKGQKRKRQLYRDKYGFCVRDTKVGDKWLVTRFYGEDEKKIKKFIEENEG